MQIISRAEARAAGLKRYYTGKTCKHGHVAERGVHNKVCKECAVIHSTKYIKENGQRSRGLSANQCKEKKAKRAKRYYEKNKEALIARRRQYKAEYRNRPYAKAYVFLSGCIRRTVQNKSALSVELIGYTAQQLRDHLERQFAKGMSWDNYGEWHIDHIRPVSKLMAGGETDPAVINCLSNLRPIWASENISKNNRQTHLL